MPSDVVTSITGRCSRQRLCPLVSGLSASGLGAIYGDVVVNRALIQSKAPPRELTTWNLSAAFLSDAIRDRIVTRPPQVCHQCRLALARTSSRNQMKNKNIKWTAAGMLASIAFGTSALAQSSDALLDKLVEKGILTTKEANELKEETDKGFTTAYSVKSGMPDWVTALRFNGDFRGRYENFDSDNPL